jgi:hypothetical protein
MPGGHHNFANSETQETYHLCFVKINNAAALQLPKTISLNYAPFLRKNRVANQQWQNSVKNGG